MLSCSCRPGLWHKAKRIVLTQGQTELKVDLPLPIVACNLMIEYADFYDNLQASAETLQCPRCSASVPANPGVCGNCGENVFQCHKCRLVRVRRKGRSNENPETDATFSYAFLLVYPFSYTFSLVGTLALSVDV